VASATHVTSGERARRIARVLWPWLVGGAIVIVIALRVPLDAFRDAVDKGPHLKLLVVDVALTLVMLVADSLATWIGLGLVEIPMRFGKVFAIRGATYLLSLLNYVVGQGGLAYYLHRIGIPTARAISAALFLTGTTLATLLVLTTATWIFQDHAAASPTMWWTLIGGCVAFAGYLVVIALAPAFLTRRESLASLFVAKLYGHAIAIATRVPHVLALVLSHWFAMRAWGIEVPFGLGVMTLPAVVIAAALPISPAGFGTTQAAMVYLYADYAAGATASGREAAMLAFSIVHFAYFLVAQAMVGLACIPMTRRLTAEAARSPEAVHSP
jgi:hypothetical protein